MIKNIKKVYLITFGTIDEGWSGSIWIPCAHGVALLVLPTESLDSSGAGYDASAK